MLDVTSCPTQREKEKVGIVYSIRTGLDWFPVSTFFFLVLLFRAKRVMNFKQILKSLNSAL